MLSRYDAVLSALDAGVGDPRVPTPRSWTPTTAPASSSVSSDLEGRLATDPQWVFLEADHSPMPVERFPVMQVIASQGAGARPDHDRPAARSDGDVWLEVNAVPVLDDAGQLEQVAVTFIDITDRMQARADAGRSAEEESRLAFDGSRVATCLVANDGRIIAGEPGDLRPARPHRGGAPDDELPRGDPPRRCQA